MKRQQKRNSRKKNRNHTSAPANVSTDAPVEMPTRRRILIKARNGGIAALALGGGGWFAVNEVRATMREHDLSQIGNGVPAIVQIHDPQCPRCVTLQREARDAICGFEEGQLQFLVANIRTAKGRTLADAHGVGHVTLLLFDAEGTRRGVLTGANNSEFLAHEFRRHVNRYGQG